MSKHLPAGKKTLTGSWRGGSYESFPHWSSMIICLLRVIFNIMRMSVCLGGLELWGRAKWRVFLRVEPSKIRQKKESLCLHFTQPLATRHLVYFSLIFHEHIQGCSLKSSPCDRRRCSPVRHPVRFSGLSGSLQKGPRLGFSGSQQTAVWILWCRDRSRLPGSRRVFSPSPFSRCCVCRAVLGRGAN